MCEHSNSSPVSAATLDDMHRRQMLCWPLAAANYAAMHDVQVREADGWRVQFNPARALSARARVDRKSLEHRPCFLCRDNRPAEQLIMQWRDYEILVNPYPIFDRHFTIVSGTHRPQSVDGRLADMAALSRMLDGYIVFYNGPTCGASAPDHMHLQAALLPEDVPPVIRPDSPCRRIIVTDSIDEAAEHVSRCRDCNIVAYDGTLNIFPRKAHRPHDYDTTMLSPGAIDVAGTFITILPEVFAGLTGCDIERVLAEVCETDAG